MNLISLYKFRKKVISLIFFLHFHGLRWRKVLERYMYILSNFVKIQSAINRSDPFSYRHITIIIIYCKWG